MQIQPISFGMKANLSKGREEFEKLSLEKRVVLKAEEKFRQKYNESHFPGISQKQGDLADYVRHIVMCENIVRNKANEIFKNVRNALKI